MDTPTVIIRRQGENWSNPAFPSAFGEALPRTTPLTQGPRDPGSPSSGEHETPLAPLLPLLSFESSRTSYTSFFIYSFIYLFVCFCLGCWEAPSLVLVLFP